MKALKCKDLMIFDWIQDIHQFPMQVRVVGEDYLYADFEGNEADMWEFDDKTDTPYPIPLTEGILEKNGLYFGLTSEEQDFVGCIGVSCYHKEHWVLDEGDGCIIVIDFPNEKDGGQISICNIMIDKYIRLVRDELFVHELQHALRLAGLTEMANNIKL